MAQRSRSRAGAEHLVVVSAPNRPPFAVPDSKVCPPPARDGLIERHELLERMSAPDGPAIVAVVAPAGYGKTTLLRQWASTRSRPVAWMNADVTDNDPTTLMVHLATALDRASPVDPDRYQLLVGSDVGVVKVTLMVSLLERVSPAVDLVIDHAEAITSPECQHLLRHLVLHAPSRSRLVLASRHDTPVPSARLRAEGRLLEIGVDDLAITEAEAPQIFHAAGVDPGPMLASLVQRTEGWAVGLYLSALAMSTAHAATADTPTFRPTDRFLVDYLRSEILDRSSPDDVSFLSRTSILDSLSGPLCDSVLETSGSAERLEDLERRNLLLVPLDHHREWYRYHHLFRELLHADLKRNHPELVAELHTRAAPWHESAGMVEMAISHAQLAGDAKTVTRLVLEQIQPVWAMGRIETVISWMEWFDDRQSVDHDLELAVHGALLYAMLGRVDDSDRWAEAASRADTHGTAPDGSTLTALLAYMRAHLCPNGIAQMRTDAELSQAELSPSSPYRASMTHVVGLSFLLDGKPGEAAPILHRAHEEATAADSTPLAAVALVEESMAHAQRQDWSLVEALTRSAVDLLDNGTFDNYWTSALVYAWAARLAATRRDDTAAALDLSQRANRLRPLLTAAMPVIAVQALLELGLCCRALNDPTGARAALAQIDEILARRPKLGVLVDEANRLRIALAGESEAAIGASSLTAAELRVLPLLATHYTLAEIAERRHVSRNTVKSQAIAIYRKLGASSRSDAIARARAARLLAD